MGGHWSLRLEQRLPCDVPGEPVQSCARRLLAAQQGPQCEPSAAARQGMVGVGGGVRCRCMQAAPSMGVLSLGVHAPQGGFRGREPTHDVSVGTTSIGFPSGGHSYKD